MAKTRLTKEVRQIIFRDAKNHLWQLANDRFEIAKVYDGMLSLVENVLEKEFPVTDMAILDKYNVSRKCSCIRVCLDGNSEYVKEFALPQKRSFPERYTGCSMIQVSGKEAERWFSSIDERNSYVEKRQEDYHALIFGSKYLEDVAEIYPHASIYAHMLGGSTALMVVDSPALERIKEDVKRMEKVA